MLCSPPVPRTAPTPTPLPPPSPGPPRALVAAALTLLLPAVFVAPVSVSAQQETFGEVIDVRVIEVEVVVTDEAGDRVRGLDRDDFRLRVSGREMPIEYFDEWRDGEPAPAAGGPEASGSADRSPAAAPAVGTRYLVFLDDYFTARRYRGAVLDRVLRDVDSLARRDRMAVVRYRGQGVEVLSEWTGSQQELRRVLEEVRSQPSWELRRQARLDNASNPANRVKIRAQQIREATGAAAASMRALADAPGRKILVIASAGWPYDLPTGGADVSARSDANRLGGVQLLRPITDTANLLGYTVYPFHLGTRAAGPSSEARELDDSGVPELAEGNTTGSDAGTEPGSSSTDVASIANYGPLGSLQHVAAETGGRVFAYSPAQAGLFRSVVEDARTYYSLGFQAPMRGDGGARSIEVEVLRDGLTVRHRQSYRDLTRQERADQRAEAALLVGNATGPPLDATLGEPRTKRRSMKVPITLRIPMDWVTMTPKGDGVYAAELELRVAALDDDGDRSEIAALPVALSGPEPPPGVHAVYETSVKLRRESHRLVLTLRDPLSGETLVHAEEVVPP